MNPQELAVWTEKRNALVAQIAEAHEKDDHAKWQELRTQIDNMDAEAEKHRQQEERNAWHAQLEKRNQIPETRNDPNGNVRERRDESAEFDPRSTKQYRNAFLSFLGNPLDVEHRRDVSFVAGPQGQFALAPSAMDPLIVTPATTALGMRGLVNLTLLPGTMTREGLSITARSGGFSKGRQVTLGTTAQASITFAKRKLTLNPFVTHLYIDNPFLANAPLGGQAALDFLAGQINELKEEGEEYYYLYGTGNSEPLGILTADSNGVPSSKHIEADGSGGAMTFKQLVAAQYAVRPKWRNSASWYFSKDACIMIDSLKDSQGNPIVKESVSLNGPIKTLLGRPIIEHEGITAAFTNATSGVFADNTLAGFYGDLKKYDVIQSSTPAIKTDTSRLVELDQTLLLCLTWYDGQPVDKDAFSVVKIVN